MNKVLIAVDDTKASKAVLTTFHNSVLQPEEVILLHVERVAGRSLMIDMLGETELSTLKDAIRDTEHKEALDKKAGKILDFYRNELNGSGQFNVRTIIREGITEEEIIKVADAEGVELIILGNSGRKGLNRIIAGSVSKDVKKHARVPVLVAKKAPVCEEPYTWEDALAAVSVTTGAVVALFLLGIIFQ